jgi:MinD superfamily P-loop ATPase
MEEAVRRQQLVPQREPHAYAACLYLFDLDPDEPGKAILTDSTECVEISQRRLRAVTGLARHGCGETAFEARLEVIMASAKREPDFKPFTCRRARRRTWRRR